MPTLTLLPADNGKWNVVYLLQGAATVWEAVDDDPLDPAYPDINSLIKPLPPISSVSVRVNQIGLHNVLPTAVRVTVNARTALYSVIRPQNSTLQAGFATYDGTVAVGAQFEPTASSLDWTTTFAVNPYTGAAWARGDLAGLEIYTQLIFVPSADTNHLPRIAAMHIKADYEDGRYGSKRGPGAIE